MIAGHGAAGARVMLIADGASAEDVNTGYAISGSAETTLRQLGFNVRDYYRTALIKEKINLTDFDSYKDQKEFSDGHTRDNYNNILFEEINTIRPNLLIPMGELSFRHLSGLQGIRKYRGSVGVSNLFTDRIVKTLPILGPQPYLNQEYRLRFVTQVDAHKIDKYANDDLPPESKLNIWISQSSSALRSFLERAYKPDGLLVFDIETYLGIPTCLSLCFDGLESVCVPIGDATIDLDNRMLMIQLVAQLLASPIKKVNQNITYDARIMNRFHYWINNISGDTAIAAACLYPELDKNLGFLTSIYTELPYHKDEGKEFNPEIMGANKKEQFYFYCCKDSLATWQVNKQQQEEIDELGSRFVYNNLVKLIPVYKTMEDNGIRIDDERRQSLLAKYTYLFETHKLMFQRLSGSSSANPLSSMQMNKLVYDGMGFPRLKQANTTEEGHLEYHMAFSEAKHAPKSGKTILKEIINCRKIHKVLELLELPLYPDGILRCTYNLGGAETGRTKSGKNKTERLLAWKDGKLKSLILGHSFQNLGKHGFIIDGEQYGKDIRSIFVPSPGYIFVECDLSQAEARVDAVLSGNFDILKVFDGPIGIHRLTGSWLYSCNPLSIKKNTLEYLIAKTARHAFERNVKEDTFVILAQSQIDRKEAARVLKVLHGYQPEIREVFHRDIKECVNSTGVLVAPNGRRRMFMDRPGNHRDNEAISQLPQCIVSDQTKFSLIPTYHRCRDFARLLNEAHDGTLAEIKKGREEEYMSIYKKNIETPIDFRQGSIKRDYELTIPMEASMSRESWYDMEDFK